MSAVRDTGRAQFHGFEHIVYAAAAPAAGRGSA